MDGAYLFQTLGGMGALVYLAMRILQRDRTHEDEKARWLTELDKREDEHAADRRRWEREHNEDRERWSTDLARVDGEVAALRALVTTLHTDWETERDAKHVALGRASSAEGWLMLYDAAAQDVYETALASGLDDAAGVEAVRVSTAGLVRLKVMRDRSGGTAAGSN